MLCHCLKCWKNTESKNLKVVKVKNGRRILLSICTVCNSKKLKFIKKHEARELLNSLGIRTPLSQTSLLDPLLFLKYKMNKITNKSLLALDKFISEMHLRQLGFTYSAC